MWDCCSEDLEGKLECLSDGFAMPMGQCGFVLEAGGVKVAIDLVVSDLFYKGTDISRRRIEPPFPVASCPGLDLILVSHDHADHLDRALIEDQTKRNENCRVIAPACILDSLDIPDCSKLYVGNYGSVRLGGLFVKAIPILHMDYENSSPGFSRFYGYLLRWNGLTVFHGGDTLSSRRLVDDISRYRPDYVMLPINGRDPERLSKGIVGNMDACEAIDFAVSVGAKALIPTHFDFFKENGADVEACRHIATGRMRVVVPVPGRCIDLGQIQGGQI